MLTSGLTFLILFFNLNFTSVFAMNQKPATNMLELFREQSDQHFRDGLNYEDNLLQKPYLDELLKKGQDNTPTQPEPPKTDTPAPQSDATPEEGGRFADVKKGPYKWECDKPQNATKCTKIPPTEIVRKDEGTGPKELLGTPAMFPGGEAGNRYVQNEPAFSLTTKKGYLVEQKPKLKLIGGKPVYVISGKPEKVDPDAMDVNSPIKSA